MSEVARYMMPLEWKDFNISLPAVFEWLKENIEEDLFVGLQAHSVLEVWFKDAPSEETMELIKLYWDEIAEDSPEVSSYKSMAEIEEQKTNAKKSAMEKLQQLGLSAEEVAALIG